MLVKTGINNLPPPNFPSGSKVSDVKTDNQGNIYITGKSENPIIFSNTTIGNVFLVKYDTNGNLVFGTNINSGTPIKLQVNFMLFL